MPQPTSSQVHVDAVLTNISVAYMQNPANFIAGKVFPVVPVEKKSDIYYKYTKEDWFRDEAKPRAAGTESAGSGYGLQTDNYLCDKFAFHKDVDDDTINNADAPLDPERDATMFISNRLALRQEVQWADDAFRTGVWATDMQGVAGAPAGGQFRQWSDYSNSDPVNDMDNGRAEVLETTGFEPNTLVLGYDVYRKLKNHPDLIDRIKYSGEKVLTLALMAMLFEVERIFVCKAIRNTAKEKETPAMSFVHGKHAWLGYVSPTPGILTPSAGYTFAWKGVSAGLGETVAIKRFRMEKIESWRIEGNVAFDNKIVAADLGYFFADAAA